MSKIFDSKLDEATPLLITLKQKAENEEKYRQKGCRRYFGIFLALTAALLSSFTTLIAKLLSEYHPFNEAMWRFQGILLPSIPILLYSKFVEKEDVFTGIYNWKTFGMLLVRAFCGCTAVILQFYAIQFIDIGDVTVISFTTPIFVAILAHFLLGEKLGFVPIIISLVTLGGIIIIARPPFISGQDSFNADVLIGVILSLGCMLIATFTYVALRWLKTVHYALVTSFYGFFSVIECVIGAAIIGQLEIPRTPEHWSLAILLAFFAFGCQSAFTIALKYEDAGPVSIIRTSEVVFVFIWQAAFLGDLPDALSIIGGALVLSSVLATGLRKWLIDLPEENPTRQRFSYLLK